MIRSIRYMFLAATLVFVPCVALGQGGYGRGGVTQGRYAPSAPKLPGVELAGPLDSATARVLLGLNDQESAHYAQVYDSFVVATRPQRDSAGVATAKMNERLDAGDRAAALFYAERLQELGKYLKAAECRLLPAQLILATLLLGDPLLALFPFATRSRVIANGKRARSGSPSRSVARMSCAGRRRHSAAGASEPREGRRRSRKRPSPTCLASPRPTLVRW